MKGKICSLISVLFLTGCSDFLEERSQDEVRPSMVNDLEQILLGDGYQESNFYYATEIFTDNVESVGHRVRQRNHNMIRKNGCICGVIICLTKMAEDMM